jgi:DNA-binding winged helix-turn-helix (wHTH) protein
MTPPANFEPLQASRRDRVIARPRAVTETIGTQASGAVAIGSMAGDTFCFGRCRLVVRERLLLKDNVLVSIGSRAFDLLLALVERAGETVNSQELFERVWPDVIVAKVNLRVHVAGLRKALGDGRDGNRFIVSVAGRGYRFVAAVNRFQSAVPAAVLTKYSTASLPPPLHSMFRREAVVAALSSQLSRKRFISLSGPGEWGHASVASAIAHTLATDFDNAVCFVDLADVDDPAHVAMAVAAALGCEGEPQQALSCVLGYLREKKMLLAFDNCERVFAGVAQLIERLFTDAPLVQILIGSREALHLSHAFAAEK